MLTTNLGPSRLLARPGDRRLWLLDPPAAALWVLYAAGYDARQLAALLGDRHGLDATTAAAQVTQLLRDWQQAGMLESAGETTADWRLGTPDEPVWPAPKPRPLESGAWALRVADRRVGLRCEAAALDQRLGELLVPRSQRRSRARRCAWIMLCTCMVGSRAGGSRAMATPSTAVRGLTRPWSRPSRP